MLSANQIAGFLTQRFLQNKLVKEPQFLHVDTCWLGMVKNECKQSGLWTLKLTVSQ